MHLGGSIFPETDAKCYKDVHILLEYIGTYWNIWVREVVLES